MIVDKDTIDEILQRPLNYARQSELAQYLAARKQHKFPPVLVVISQDWVDQLDSDEWDADGRAVISAARFSPSILKVGTGSLIYRRICESSP